MASGPLIVGAEGVLLIPEKDVPYASSRPIMEGIELVMQLKHFPTSNATIIVHTQDLEGAAYFVKINGLPETGCTSTALEDKNEPTPMAQWWAIERIRARASRNNGLSRGLRALSVVPSASASLRAQRIHWCSGWAYTMGRSCQSS